MSILFRLLLLLPLAVAWPDYIQCANDEATRLKLGETMMGATVVEAWENVTIQALRNGVAVSSYIPGEVLQVQVKGFPEKSSAILRASDKSNTTIQTENTNGLWKASNGCVNQAHVVHGMDVVPGTDGFVRNLPGTEATVSFRPGCNSNEPLKLTFVTANTKNVPIYLSELLLTLEGKQDPSCTTTTTAMPPSSTPPSNGDSAVDEVPGDESSWAGFWKEAKSYWVLWTLCIAGVGALLLCAFWSCWSKARDHPDGSRAPLSDDSAERYGSA